MARGRVNYGSWLLNVLAWDGLLVAGVALIPTGIELLFPNRRGAIEITALVLPIVALFLRIRAGTRHITSNHCTAFVRGLQFVAFFLGVLPLLLIDAFLILSHVMPRGALVESKSDLLIWVAIVAIYLALMAVAMYPGRTPSPPAWDDANDPASWAAGTTSLPT